MAEQNAQRTRKPAQDAAPEENENPVAETPQDDETPRFSKQQVIEDAYPLTGYPSHVLAGALHGDDRDELTAAEAKDAAANWLGA